MRHFYAALALLVSLVALASPTQAASLVNSDFSGPEVMDLADITRGDISTTEPMGTWLLGGHDGGTDDWDIDAGFFAANDTGTEGQGLVQWIQDNKATTGATTLDFDFLMDSGSGGDYDLILYVAGWNAGDNAPGVDYENGTVETGDSFVPNDSVSLITDPVADAEGRLVLANDGAAVFSGVVDNGVFQDISVNVDFGTGYDFIGVVFYAENGGGLLHLDNVQFASSAVIPEPSTATLGLFSLAGLGLLRRRSY